MRTCPVCGQENCRVHTNARVVRLDAGLVARMIQAPRGDDGVPVWERYSLTPGKWGIPRLNILINRPAGCSDDLDALNLWVQNVDRAYGHTYVHLVAVPGPAQGTLYLHEGDRAFLRVATVVAAGRTARYGHFALATTPFAPPTRAMQGLRPRRVGVCQRCGRYGRVTVHHIVPLSRGGTDDPDNLLLLCPTCHAHAENLTMRLAFVLPWEGIRQAILEGGVAP